MRHVGEDDAVAGLEAVEDFDGVDGGAAELDRAAVGEVAVLLEFEDADGAVLLAEGRAAEAVELSRAGLALHAGYRPLAYLHAASLLRVGKAGDALKFLDDQQRTWPSDGHFHMLKAEAHNALGQVAESHLAQAEAYVLADRIAAAIEQLQMAQRAGKADFYTLSIIDARLRDLRERQRRESASDVGSNARY